MAELYFPRSDSEGPLESKEDLDYAEYFGYVARVLEASADANRLALRLSTCRNVFLTINALFVDLQGVLGHGAEPSLLHQAVEQLRRDRLDGLDAMLGQVDEHLESYDSKRSVWEHREEIDRELWASVASLGALGEARVKRLVANVRTYREGCSPADSWDHRWYEFAAEEVAWARERLARLHQARGVAGAVATALGAASAYLRHEDGSRPSPGGRAEEPVGGERWGELYTCLSSEAAALGLVRMGEGDGAPLAGHILGKGDWLVPEQVDSPDKGRAQLVRLCDYLESRERALYSTLSALFRPNLGRAPLPPPYRVDLSDAFATSRAEMRIAGALEKTFCRTFGRAAPASITVALCEFGIPMGDRDSRLARYRSEDRRQEAEQVAAAAVEAITAEPNPVLVLPELFLPTAAVERVAGLAQQKGVTLIAGVEPTEGAEGTLVNQAVIVLPRIPWQYDQTKARSSPYENRFSYAGSAVYVLGGTEIGSFAVVVCSDFREFDLLAAIANASCLIDTLFVCSYNPQPELFECFAMADAARLYCHVVVANTCPGETPELATANGTLVCSPMSRPDQRRRIPARSVPIALPPIGGRRPSLALYEIAIHDLQNGREKEKPTAGYLNCPHFRRTPLHV